MRDIQLPVWLRAEEISKLRDAAQAYWLQAQEWMQWPLNQLDEFITFQPLLGLIAQERGIKPIPGESIDMFRARVKHAASNAEDAGSVEGFKRIFERLGLDIIDIQERLPNQDWDIVNVEVADSLLSENGPLLDSLLRTYGRTCRRYQYSLVSLYKEYLSYFSNDFINESANITDRADIVLSNDFDQATQLFSLENSTIYSSFLDVIDIEIAFDFVANSSQFSTSFNSYYSLVEG